jgi:diguanylate cyclase (GGDEF)-like protein
MNAKRKITLILSIIFSLIFLMMIINISLNFRSYGIKSVEDKALVISELIKHSLTAHMVNGTMDKRDFFLNQIKNSRHIEKLWIIRAPSVIKQHGVGFENETSKDDIDKEVIRTGVAQKVITENLFLDNMFRMTIPYNASANSSLNCLKCHDAKAGDTLGAISMIINIDDIKLMGLKTVFDIALVAFAVLILIQIFTGRFLTPYLMIFISIKDVMNKAHLGDYSNRVDVVGNKESVEVAILINKLMEKFQHVLNEIESKIDIFLSHKKEEKLDDQLESVKNTITQLSDIYKFKKTIEHDKSIEDIYKRLIVVFENKLHIKDFTFVECDTTRKNTKVIYASKKINCHVERDSCRADRASVIIDSCQFQGLCKSFNENDDRFYICIPYPISNDLDLIISIVSDTYEETQRVNSLIHCIDDYIDTAKTEFVSKKLTQKLRDRARRDPLTNLYNRKYLEEFIDIAIVEHKEKGTSYGILMADIDYFKMINDTYGHNIGDLALKVITATLLENTLASDIVVRYGGEEFIIILYNCDKKRLIDVAENIRVSFSKKKIRVSEDMSFTKTISLGGSLLPNNTDSFWKAIKLADVALYEAKNSGRDRVEIFDIELEQYKNFDFDKEY